MLFLTSKHIGELRLDYAPIMQLFHFLHHGFSTGLPEYLQPILHIILSECGMFEVRISVTVILGLAGAQVVSVCPLPILFIHNGLIVLFTFGIFIAIGITICFRVSSSHSWDLTTILGGLFQHSCGANGFNFVLSGLICHSCIANRLGCFGFFGSVIIIIVMIITDHRRITDIVVIIIDMVVIVVTLTVVTVSYTHLTLPTTILV